MIDENTSRQVEELYRSDDWAELRWAREHSTPQQIARHLLDPQWRNRDYNALDELVEMTHDADLSSLDEDDLETLAASGLPELRQAVIRYAGTPARLFEDMARTESNTRLLQMLVESGKLSQNAIDLCCWNQTDSRLAASMLTKASDDLLHRLSGRDWWPSRKNAVESGRLDRRDLDDMIKTENHPDVVSALIGTGEFDMDSEVNAIRRVITSPGLLTTYTNPMNRRYSLDQSRQEVVRQAARTMLEHAPVGMILSMPDDDDENWRTLIDTAATEYAGELGKDMLGLIAQSEGNTQARTILAGRGFPKAAASNAERTLAASPGADGTYGFNLRLLGRLKDDVDYFLGPSHAEKYLWAGSVDAQIAKLREIDGTIRPEDRPEWFTTEWIDQAEREMKDPSDNTGTALDAALSGQYAAFENAVIGYIDAHDTDAGTSENGASQFAGYEVAARDANILSMTEADGTGKGAARFWAKVAAGDWDAVIVRQDTFQRMHVSPERREKYFERRKAEMLDSIETAKSDGNDFSAKKLKDEIGKMEKNLGKTVKQAEKDRMRVDGKLQALRDSGESKEWIDFEDLGVDMLFVDEAHQYKNLAIATTISVPGVDVAAAQKCEDLFDKCEYLREAGHGSNIVFATGTPVSNSMAELYNMQRYLAPDLLKAQGVEAFTSWANTYGSIVESVEVKPEGSGYQIKQRFAKFHNLPELMSTFHDYADLLTADQLDLDVPDCEVVSVAVEATEAQKQAVDALVERAELVRDGAVDPSDDNMLNITNDGRKVSLDPKLLDVSDPDIQPMEGGKVQVCAEKIHEIWREHAEEKATQLVFCDSSTTASGKWNIQSDLKRRLVDLGIPEDEIMFAAQEKDPQKKQALFEKVRKGEVRVLIGSTGTLGTGTNVQDRLFAIHDLDCPWKPAELEQRQGRVRRQGNMFDNVQDYRYVTVGTFDSYMFQTVERKARFISQIMSSGSPSREASDVDATVLSLADMKAIATGDPNIAKRMELENQLTQMKLLKRAHADQQRSIRFKIDMQLQPTVDHLERLHDEALDDEPKFREAVEIRGQHLTRGICGLNLGNGPIMDRRQAIHDLVGIARGLDRGETREVGEYCGLTVMVASRNMAVNGLNVFRPFVGLKGEHEHWAGTSAPDINNSADSVIRQLDRIISNNTNTAQSLGVKLGNAKASLESAWNALNQPWEGQKEYDDLTDQIAKMNLEIKHGKGPTPAEEDGQADLAEASFHSDESQEPQVVRAAVESGPSGSNSFPATVETTDVPMPDPCVDPCNGGTGMSGLCM